MPDGGVPASRCTGAATTWTLPVQCLVTTDSLPRGHPPALPLQVESIAPLLADAISRLHHEQPLGDLLTRT